MNSRLVFIVSTLLFAPTALFCQDAAKDPTPAPPATTADAQPDPRASGVSKSGHKGTPPKVIFSVEPIYPKDAARMKLHGICTVSLIVDAQGKPKDVHVINSDARGRTEDEQEAWGSLERNAVEAAQHYRFEPAKVDGKAVPVRVTVVVEFRIH